MGVGRRIRPMPTFEYVTEIRASIERVWGWYEQVGEALPALSAPGDGVELEPPVPERAAEGMTVVIRANGPLGRRIRWVARYVAYVPPHPVVYGVEARFVDEQVEGPFKTWRHAHEFEALGDKQTRMVDYITYSLPAWPLSAPADWLLVKPKLKAMFDHRRQVLDRVFGTAG